MLNIFENYVIKIRKNDQIGKNQNKVYFIEISTIQNIFI